MRIIAGQWRGRALQAPPGDQVRPTSDRARGGIFSMLGSRLGRWEGRTVLDAFAGSGALGLEALSRGAAFCHFLEPAPPARALLARTIKALGGEERCRVYPHRAENPPPAPPQTSQGVDVAFFDPPYQSGLLIPAIEALKAAGWLTSATLLVLETPAFLTFSSEEPMPAMRPLKEARYGLACITLAALL